NVDVAARQAVPQARFYERMAAAADGGRYDLPRKEGSEHAMPVPGMTSTIMTRLQSFETRDGKVVNATDPELLSRAEMEGRRQALEYARFLRDRVPGY